MLLIILLFIILNGSQACKYVQQEECSIPTFLLNPNMSANETQEYDEKKCAQLFLYQNCIKNADCADSDYFIFLCKQFSCGTCIDYWNILKIYYILEILTVIMICLTGIPLLMVFACIVMLIRNFCCTYNLSFGMIIKQIGWCKFLFLTFFTPVFCFTEIGLNVWVGNMCYIQTDQSSQVVLGFSLAVGMFISVICIFTPFYFVSYNKLRDTLSIYSILPQYKI